MLRFVIPGVVAAAVIALAMRCPDLNGRPMHTDEAVNAIKFRTLWNGGEYRYDPNEHHGPSLAYSTWLFSKLSVAPAFEQFDEGRLRIVTVVFGVGLILLLPLVADGLGRDATVWAGLLTAISPTFVYYSRDYIHETVLVFFTFLAIAAGWRYTRSGHIIWALLAGAAAGFMQATKETFVLTLVALVVAVAARNCWACEEDSAMSPARFRLNRAHIAAAAGMWIIVAIALFSSFFTNARGPVDAARTYLPWFHRASGDSPHLHPWQFYLERLLWFHSGRGLIWSEGLIVVLALIGALAAFQCRMARGSQSGFPRFIALYSVVLIVLYSAIPYKTPWCALSFMQGLILLAGVGIASLLSVVRNAWLKAGVAAIVFAGASQLACQAWRASITLPADPRNPYVYAQTSPDCLNLTMEIESMAAVSPEGRHMLLKVIAPGDDYWPLPWYLRRFDQVGWWNTVPEDLSAQAAIVSARLKAPFDADGRFIDAGIFQLRPGVFLECYVGTNLWSARFGQQR